MPEEAEIFIFPSQTVCLACPPATRRVFRRYFPVPNRDEEGGRDKAPRLQSSERPTNARAQKAVRKRLSTCPCPTCTYLAVARGHANFFFIDGIGADSSAYEFLINAPLTRGRVGNCDVKNIRAAGFIRN